MAEYMWWIHPKNHGTLWSTGEMKKLRRLCPSGYVDEKIAHAMGRTTTACSDALRTIRKMEMLYHGEDSDTLKTWKQKEKGND